MFSTQIISVSTCDGRNFTSLKDFSFTDKFGTVYIIPAGTTSDGASTPCEIWPTIPPFGRYWLAAFFHDYLYRYTQLPKVLCDDLFEEAMISLGVSPLEADIIYEGVNLCGQSSFDADRAAQIQPQ